jgi:beta-galactosidase
LLQGLRTKSATGVEYMAYGGDWGDDPNDGHFCMDGLLFSNHTPTPGLAEYRKAVEPVQTVSLKGKELTIVNRYDHLSLDHLNASWYIVDETGQGRKMIAKIPPGIKPHTEAKITLDGLPSKFNGETYVRISFRLTKGTAWASPDFGVAFGEHQLNPPRSLSTIYASLPAPSMAPAVGQQTPGNLSITSASGQSSWSINLTLGALSAWHRPGQGKQNMLTEPVTMDFYRALTDNDRGGRFGQQWLQRRLHQTKHHVRSVAWKTSGTALEVLIRGRIAPPALAWGVDVDTRYTFCGESVMVRVKGKPGGPLLPDTFARIGLTLGLRGAESARWFGRGPGESYADKKMAQAFGLWEATVDEMFVDYEYPQDGGNRTDVRTVEFYPTRYPSSDPKDRRLRAQFGSLEGASFSAMRYSTADLDAMGHPYQLREKIRGEEQGVVVRLDWAHHGLGTGSCGPATLRQYELRTGEFQFEVLLD